MWIFGLIVLIMPMLFYGSMGNEDYSSSRKFTIEELLSMTFPYTDQRIDHQLDMDPCKSGEHVMVVVAFP